MVIGPIQFASPVWLLLAPVLIALSWWLSRSSLAGLGTTTRWVALVVRSIVLIGLCATLAEPNLRREGEGVALVVVMDGSSSMPRTATDDVVAFLDPYLNNAGPSDRLGLVTTAEQAYARSLAREGVRPGDAMRDIIDTGMLDPGGRSGTDLADGLQMGLTVSPTDAATRILLVSDGNETEGNVLRVAERAQALGVPVDVLPVERDVASEVVFEQLATPSSARQGQTVNVTALFRSTREVSGRLTLSINGRAYDFTPGEPGTSTEVTLREGLNSFPIPVTLPLGGAQRFVARFDPDDEAMDDIAQNNVAQSVTFVQSEGRVLVFTTDPFETERFVESLTSSDIEVQTLLPNEGPRTIEGLSEYDAVILFDTPASAFDGGQIEHLAQFVADSGGGLLMVGGPDSFGAGGWIGSPVADVLPVRLDVPERRNMPKGALAIVVDTSGSMGAPIGGTSMTQLDAAEEGAIAGINALSSLDLATVIRFDTSARTVLPLGEVGDKEAAARKIRSMDIGGGTNMFPGLRKAMQELLSVDVGVRHIIVLSDGQTTDDGSLPGILKQAIDEEVSISAVSIGDWANDPLMANLANQTGGLFHIVKPNPAGLAAMEQIFIIEAQIVKRALIWEGDPFNPERTGAPSVPMRSIPTPVPAIDGYVVTTDREGLSIVTLRGPEPDRDPILAHWQHGLGRVVAYTSDATNRWGEDWVSWGAYRSFWEQHVRWAMRPTGSANLDVVTINDGPRTKVTVNALDQEGEPLNFARFTARVIGPDGEAIDLAMPQAAPGRYEGWFDSSDEGSHLVTIAYQARTAGDGDLERGTVQASVTRSFSDEFKQIQPNPGLLRTVAELTGGRVLTEQGADMNLFDTAGLTQPVSLRPVWLAFALVCAAIFLSDVAVRRVRIVPREILASALGAFRHTQTATTSQVDALKAARDKAAARLKQPPSVATKQAAKQKFEAKPGTASAGPVVSARPPAEKPRTSQGDSAPMPAAEEEDGMSRLMRAKRRAASSMSQDDDN